MALCGGLPPKPTANRTIAPPLTSSISSVHRMLAGSNPKAEIVSIPISLPRGLSAPRWHIARRFSDRLSGPLTERTRKAKGNGAGSSKGDPDAAGSSPLKMKSRTTGPAFSHTALRTQRQRDDSIRATASRPVTITSDTPTTTRRNTTGASSRKPCAWFSTISPVASLKVTDRSNWPDTVTAGINVRTGRRSFWRWRQMPKDCLCTSRSCGGGDAGESRRRDRRLDRLRPADPSRGSGAAGTSARNWLMT